MIDFNELPETQEDAKSGDFTDLPAGAYKVSIERCEDKTNRNGKPYTHVGMIVQEGEHKGRWIWLSFYHSQYGIKDLSQVAFAAGVMDQVKAMKSFDPICNQTVEIGIRYKDGFTNMSKVSAWSGDGVDAGPSASDADAPF